MERQGRGGGSATVGAFSGKTADTTADGGAAPQAPTARLRRRLGRADLRAVPESRRALRELLGPWGRPEQCAIAELLTSELVTNALVHTDREAVLTATVGPGGLRVEVRDFAAREPRPRVPAADGTNGRGLVLVESLADEWGVRAHGVGKAVWFALDADAA
ncbi:MULTISPECIES: ATP-binding protein [Streptomyces]|uniref:ATP-binding protein n=1 Tax=Streptomyces viridosporus T7A TaxID=665577 RepID=A0ABX6AMS4_STRVD|nr:MULTISPECIES: ATP-binding protein [Streptomyces]PWJ03774.1 ATP-binding protein [Streptomyces sp. NWU49]QEU88419.1 ATP-binding protein [Streptomyces viridosporus T7A]